MNELSSEQLWAEFDEIDAAKKAENFARTGLTDEVLGRLARRGIRVDEVIFDAGPEGENVHYNYTASPSTPAYNLHLLKEKDPDLSDEEKAEITDRFYKDAKTEDDDDYMRAQWPELYGDIE